MADDEKILRIEAKFSEDKKGSDKPVSSAGADRVEAPEVKSPFDPTQFGILEQARQHTDRIAQIFKDLFEKEETPLPQPPTPSITVVTPTPTPPAGNNNPSILIPTAVPASSKPTAQIPSATPAAAQTQTGSNLPPPPPNIPRWGSGATTASEEGAYFPGGIQLPPMPPSVAAPAGGAAAAGAAGAAGATAGAAGATTGFTGAVTAAGTAITSFVTGPVGLWTLAITAGTAAMAGLTGLFLSAFELLERQFEEFSASLSEARAQQDIELTLQKIKSGEKATGKNMPWDESSALMGESTDFYKNLIALGEKVINILGPFVELIAEITNDLLDCANGILEIVKYLVLIIELPIKGLAVVLRLVRKACERFLGVSGEVDNDTFQTEVVQFFAGRGTSRRPEGNARQPFPPQANQPDHL